MLERVEHVEQGVRISLKFKEKNVFCQPGDRIPIYRLHLAYVLRHFIFYG